MPTPTLHPHSCSLWQRVLPGWWHPTDHVYITHHPPTHPPTHFNPQCVNTGQTTQFSCQGDTYFNPSINVCDFYYNIPACLVSPSPYVYYNLYSLSLHKFTPCHAPTGALQCPRPRQPCPRHPLQFLVHLPLSHPPLLVCVFCVCYNILLYFAPPHCSPHSEHLGRDQAAPYRSNAHPLTCANHWRSNCSTYLIWPMCNELGCHITTYHHPLQANGAVLNDAAGAVDATSSNSATASVIFNNLQRINTAPTGTPAANKVDGSLDLGSFTCPVGYFLGTLTAPFDVRLVNAPESSLKTECIAANNLLLQNNGGTCLQTFMSRAQRFTISGSRSVEVALVCVFVCVCVHVCVCRPNITP